MAHSCEVAVESISALLAKNEADVLLCLESEIKAWQIEDKPVAFFFDR